MPSHRVVAIYGLIAVSLGNCNLNYEQFQPLRSCTFEQKLLPLISKKEISISSPQTKSSAPVPFFFKEK